MNADDVKRTACDAADFEVPAKRHRASRIHLGKAAAAEKAGL